MSLSERGFYYEFDLDHHLQTWVDGYEQDRTAYWSSKLEAEEWSPFKQLMEDADDIAASIRKRAMTLQNIDDYSKINDIYQAYQAEREAANQSARDFYDKVEAAINEESLPQGAAEILSQYAREQLEQAGKEIFDPQEAEEDSDRPLHLIWERLCIDDAWEIITTMRERIRRIFLLDQLIDEVLHNQAPELCIEFLGLVSRCYIYGFVPECVAMCRSAMEQAFREKVSYELCTHVDSRKGKTLAIMIQAAFDKRNNLLGSKTDKPELYKAAQAVQERGGKVMHVDSRITKDALGTIKKTLRVIDALSSLPSIS